jgi:hypothetical protein
MRTGILHRSRVGLLRSAAGLSIMVLGWTALPASASAPAAGHVTNQVVRASVIPVPGDRFAPATTAIIFRGVTPSALAGITVVGSLSGRHSGTVTSLVGGGAVFTPSRPFAAGEEVVVDTPDVQVLGAPLGSYVFDTARPAPPAAAARALQLAAETDDSAPPKGRSDLYSPAACPGVSYRTMPDLQVPQLCGNLGVTTSGTEPGSYLFATPGDIGAGIWADDGELIWWQRAIASNELNESVIQYRGEPYLAVWSGTLGTYGDGFVTLYNEHYQVVGDVTATGDFPADEIDLHEFQVTPSGDALFGIYDPVIVMINGSPQTVLQYVVQEVSLVSSSTGIHTGQLLFEWDSLTDVPTSASQMPDPGPGTAWDYFHGNAITQDGDQNLVVSARNTWGIYKIDDTPGDPDFGHVIWQVGAAGDSQLAQPWCYQHDIVALGDDEYSLFDDGGDGPGCLPGTTAHPARGLIITVNPATTPAGLTLDQSFTHDPPIYAAYTGSAQVLPDGGMLIDWANVPEITEYNSSGQVRMDLSMSAASYRGFRFEWDGQPLTPPTVAISAGKGKTTIWASWNGATSVAAWQAIAGPSAAHMAPVGGRWEKTTFETTLNLPAEYPVVAVEALSSAGAVLGTSDPVDMSGYLLSNSAGTVSGFGDAAGFSSVPPAQIGSPAVGMVETADGAGHWLATAKGAVFVSGDAHLHGSAADLHLNASIVGMAATPDGGGYWLVAADGGVFCFGNARFKGSAAGSHLNEPVVAIVPTVSGSGYWLVAADGGVFSFGDARYLGSLTGDHLNAHVVGAAAAPDAPGYWLVAADGGVFTFGGAHFFGSAVGKPLKAPAVAMATTVDGDGYWVVDTGGQVVAFGDALLYQSASAGTGSSHIVAIAGSRATLTSTVAGLPPGA